MDQKIELFVTPGCPFCAEAREDLQWRGIAFEEFDVEADAAARERMLELTGGNHTVPVVVKADRPIQIGWQGRGCSI